MITPITIIVDRSGSFATHDGRTRCIPHAKALAYLEEMVAENGWTDEQWQEFIARVMAPAPIKHPYPMRNAYDRYPRPE